MSNSTFDMRFVVKVEYRSAPTASLRNAYQPRFLVTTSSAARPVCAGLFDLGSAMAISGLTLRTIRSGRDHGAKRDAPRTATIYKSAVPVSRSKAGMPMQC
jgi:hypothetical protein